MLKSGLSCDPAPTPTLVLYPEKACDSRFRLQLWEHPQTVRHIFYLWCNSEHNTCAEHLQFFLHIQWSTEVKNRIQFFCQFRYPCKMACGAQKPLGLSAGIFMCHIQLFLMQLQICNATLTPYSVLHGACYTYPFISLTACTVFMVLLLQGLIHICPIRHYIMWCKIVSWSAMFFVLILSSTWLHDWKSVNSLY